MSGKGDAPRSCFSEDFRSNYDKIDWSRKGKAEPHKTEIKPEDVKHFNSEKTNQKANK